MSKIPNLSGIKVRIENEIGGFIYFEFYDTHAYVTLKVDKSEDIRRYETNDAIQLYRYCRQKVIQSTYQNK